LKELYKKTLIDSTLFPWKRCYHKCQTKQEETVQFTGMCWYNDVWKEYIFKFFEEDEKVLKRNLLTKM